MSNPNRNYMLAYLLATMNRDPRALAVKSGWILPSFKRPREPRPHNKSRECARRLKQMARAKKD